MRDVTALTSHLNRIASDPVLLDRLRQNSIAGLGGLTWAAAGARLNELYGQCATTRSSETAA
jgi:hypothetical protein